MLTIQSPTPLSTIVKTIVTNKVEPSTQRNVKIMRRNQLREGDQHIESGETTISSSADPSKETSEISGDSQNGTGVASPADSNVTKDKASMTREEREAKYKETRERIFQGFECAESVDLPATNDTGNGNSRTISCTGKKKTWKNRTNDGSFEVRSQYNLGYNPQQSGPAPFEQTSDSNACFNPYPIPQQFQFDPNQSGQITNAAFQQGYTQALQTLMSEPGYAMGFQHAQMFSNMATNGQHMVPPLGQRVPTSYGHDVPNTQFQRFYPHLPPSDSQSPAASSPATSHQVYPHAPYSYQQNHHHQQFQTGGPYPSDQSQTGNTSYPPATMNFQNASTDGTLQQSMSGSYCPQMFNPQTNPFVPGNVGSPFLPMHSQSQFSDGNQHQNAPFGDSHSNEFYGTAHADFMHDQRANVSRRGGSGDIRNDTNSVHSISKWSASANLPPKPPPPETTKGIQTPSPRATLPYNTRHSGQHVPTFQNGVYTLPVATSR